MIELSNGVIIPKIGFGTFPQIETLPFTAEYAYSAGYRLFDTSDNYKNEEYLGQAIKKNKNHFDDAIIITKFSQAVRTGKLGQCFDESVEKLSRKADLYLLHWPYPYLWKEQWREMENLYLEGKCKGIGVCNFEIEKMKELLAFCRVKPVINQIERHPLFQQNEIVQFCKNNKIQIMCYSPTARHDPELFESALLREIAGKYNKTVSQTILRWDIDTGTIPIPASKSEQHILENLNVFDFHLTYSEINRINSMESGRRIRFDPNKRFNLKQKVKFAIVKTKLQIMTNTSHL